MDHNQYYTPAQMAEIKKRGEELGPEKIKAVENEWPVLIRNVKAEMEAGTDPADSKVLALATRWMELVKMFTGGNPGIEKSLGKMYQNEQPVLKAEHGDSIPTPEIMEYINKVMAAAKKD